MPYPRGYLSQQQVRRLKAIPQRRRHGPPNLARAVRNVAPYDLPPLPPADNFDSGSESDEYNIPSLPPTTSSLDSDTESFVTAQEEPDYYNNVASTSQPRASGGQTDVSTSADPPVPEVAEPTASGSEEAVGKREKRSAMGTKRGAPSVSGASPPKSARMEEAQEDAMEAEEKSNRRHHQHNQLGANVYFDGWGEWTSPEGQHFTTFRKSYSKTFKSYCTFSGKKMAFASLRSTVGKEADEVTVTINHGGNTLPYWKRNASTCDEDFNQPNNVVGFRCINMGFRVPRIEVSTCPGDRTTDHEMPMNPPLQTEMWMFTDTEGDYGVPQIHDSKHPEYNIRFESHNDDFRNYFEGEVPTMPNRLQVWDKQVLLETARACNKYDHTSENFTIKDPNHIYDLTRHPGYRTLSASDGEAFALDFSPGPNQKFTMFPHKQVADLNGVRGSTGTSWKDDYKVWNKDENKYSEMDDWPINFIKTPVSDKRFDYNCDGGVVTQVRLAHWTKSCGSRGKYDEISKDYRHPTQDYCYSKQTGYLLDAGKDMLVYEAGLKDNAGGYCVSHHIVSGVTPDGHSNDVTVRPPYFMFGVHPDYERKASGIYPYKYFANMNITYFSTVEWLISSPAPSWIPLGPGGVRNLDHKKLNPEKHPPLEQAYNQETMDQRVVVGGRYDGNFFLRCQHCLMLIKFAHQLVRTMLKKRICHICTGRSVEE
ncbi:hypothetical protein PoB_004493700 [Plakobranchus ocellatus]|uniref:Uncharacterized protein n=1 Tax=Plakobranchus ocellatus TaxID=259542 RepID=A0AAV4BGP2_9GAST|nr:hypothetical protein PoB_004493700 [Plakobranchus ocellatus]